MTDSFISTFQSHAPCSKTYHFDQDYPGILQCKEESTESTTETTDEVANLDGNRSHDLYESVNSEVPLDVYAPFEQDNIPQAEVGISTSNDGSAMLIAPTDIFIGSDGLFDDTQWSSTPIDPSTNVASSPELRYYPSPTSECHYIKSEPNADLESDCGSGTTALGRTRTWYAASSSSTRDEPGVKSKRRRTAQAPANVKEPEAARKQRERNRLAAERCRRRQVNRTQILVDKVEQLEDNREILYAAVVALSSQVLGLKEELLRHNDCGCEQIQTYLQSRVHQLVERTQQRKFASWSDISEHSRREAPIKPSDRIPNTMQEYGRVKGPLG